MFKFNATKIFEGSRIKFNMNVIDESLEINDDVILKKTQKVTNVIFKVSFIIYYLKFIRTFLDFRTLS